ncbi:MAG: hypothetical protein ACT4OV_02825 [Microthrixaceae bacterium]
MMPPPRASSRATFVWGLKRSGIHLVVSWLYANLGGSTKEPLESRDLHAQLADGFADRGAGVAFYNNCGQLHSRGFALGDLQASDLEQAAARHSAAIFGIEDCALRFADRTVSIDGATTLLVLRDPLNHVASRLAAAATRPALFRVDNDFVELLDAYCAEFLGHTDHLGPKVTVSFNQFVVDRTYRDELARSLGTANLDAVSEVSDYGGGSSFSGTGSPASAAALTTRFEQHPLPGSLVEQMLARPAISEACTTVFGYDLEQVATRR